MDLLQTQIVIMSCLGIGSILSGLLPACFVPQRRVSFPLCLTSLLCAGAGVLLATIFIHILPEVHKILEQSAEIALCGGFLLVYFIDETIHFIWGEAGHTRRTHTPNECRNTYGTNQSRESVGLLARDTYRQPPYNPNVESVVCTSHRNETNESLCHVNHIEPCNQSSTGHIGLLIALTVHALLEGLVIGVQDSPNQVLILGGAVATHKLVIGFCLGLELSSTSSRCLHLTAVLVFALGSVGGIALGIIFGQNQILYEYMPSLSPIVQSVAAGTLLYVTLAEVLPRERAQWHERPFYRHAGIIQFVSVLSGFILMSIIIIYLETYHEGKKAVGNQQTLDDRFIFSVEILLFY